MINKWANQLKEYQKILIINKKIEHKMQNQNKYQIHLSLLEKVQKEENYKNNNK